MKISNFSISSLVAVCFSVVLISANSCNSGENSITTSNVCNMFDNTNNHNLASILSEEDNWLIDKFNAKKDITFSKEITNNIGTTPNPMLSGFALSNIYVHNVTLEPSQINHITFEYSVSNPDFGYYTYVEIYNCEGDLLCEVLGGIEDATCTESENELFDHLTKEEATYFTSN